MILRIMGEGQFEVSDEAIDQLNELDEQLVSAVASGDEESFRWELAALHDRILELGRPLPPDHLGASDLVLPPRDATLAEVRGLLGEEGLIPG